MWVQAWKWGNFPGSGWSSGHGYEKVTYSRSTTGDQGTQVKEHLTKFGEIIRIQDELWAAAYRYKVYNGVRLAEINLKKHIPSHLSIEDNEAMILYYRQPSICYRFKEIGHQQIDCPRKKRLEPLAARWESTWADVVSKSIQEPNKHTQMRQANTTQGHRTESPTRLVDRPLWTKHCINLQGTQALPNATDDDTSMTGQQSMAPNFDQWI